MAINHDLIAKYNVPGPRYTSYPTVPHWDRSPCENDWKKSVRARFDETNTEQGISLYIHLPFCESLCTYCGCNTRITVNHGVEIPYMEAILKEWQLYRDVFGGKPKIKEIHLGGGTPTFFSPENLGRLVSGILEDTDLHPDYEFSFEGHPKNTTREHLQVLFNHGFRRLSLGIQDFDERVQLAVNRIQSFEMVKEVVDQAREIGYRSINFDLIYGLPFQTLLSIEKTFRLVNKMRPERIAYYSYAHVPWVKPGQRRFTEMDLPTDAYKRSLYELGKELLENAGYSEVGMDHFSLPEDDLYQAMKTGRLHRNFMGYTTGHNELMIGLGVSSISDSWDMFAQNVKVVEEYCQLLGEDKLPIFRGHILNSEDLLIRKKILNLMCQFETRVGDLMRYELQWSVIRRKLKPLLDDGLISINGETLYILDKGRPFVRNVCMAFDYRISSESDMVNLFSSTI
jgi:oxygen-independent coproporphyrinogen III oxidase